MLYSTLLILLFLEEGAVDLKEIQQNHKDKIVDFCPLVLSLISRENVCTLIEEAGLTTAALLTICGRRRCKSRFAQKSRFWKPKSPSPKSVIYRLIPETPERIHPGKFGRLLDRSSGSDSTIQF